MRKFLAIALYVLADFLWPRDQRARQVLIIEPPADELDTQECKVVTEALDYDTGWIPTNPYRGHAVDWRDE